MSCLCNKSKYLCNWFLNPQKFLFYLEIGKLEVSSHIVLDPALNTSENSVSVTVLTLEVRTDVEKGMLIGAFWLLLTKFC